MVSRRVFAVGALASVVIPIRCVADPVSTTTNLQDMVDAADGSLTLPSGVFDADALRLPPGFRLAGAGYGRTIIRLADRARGAAVIVSDTPAGITGLSISSLTIDGGATRQDAVRHGMLLVGAQECRLAVEVRNCNGSGIVLSGGRGNAFHGTRCIGNGRGVPGYGLYLFGTSDNLVDGGTFDDNCIGIAVEASGRGMTATDNVVRNVSCTRNRADFGQSGAGIHYEASDGGTCRGGSVEGSQCTESTGVGINNTGCDLTVRDTVLARNDGSGIVTVGATGFRYTRLTLLGNAHRAPAGYGGEIRFDDSGVAIGSRGVVEDCTLRGTTVEGAIRTMATTSAVDFIDNRITGYPTAYVFAGKRNRLMPATGEVAR